MSTVTVNLNNPKISVIVPVYNVERYIENTMRSLISQTYKNFEIILVDDGSQDNSIKIAEEVLKSSEISYKTITQKNSGLGIARNSGFLNSTGEWVLFLDSDDTIQPFTLEIFVNTVNNNPNIDAVFSDYQSVFENDIFKPTKRNDKSYLLKHNEFIESFLKRNKSFLVPGTLYKTEFLQKNKILHKGLRWSEDQCFQWDVLNKADVIAYLDCKLYNYLTRPNSIMASTRPEPMLEAYEEFVRLANRMIDAAPKKFLLPRWVLGCLHVAAHRNEKEVFNALWDGMNGKKSMKVLLKFPDVKIKILALAGCISSKLLFKLMNR